jgi:hypothetical protein
MTIFDNAIIVVVVYSRSSFGRCPTTQAPAASPVRGWRARPCSNVSSSFELVACPAKTPLQDPNHAMPGDDDDSNSFWNGATMRKRASLACSEPHCPTARWTSLVGFCILYHCRSRRLRLDSASFQAAGNTWPS